MSQSERCSSSDEPRERGRTPGPITVEGTPDPLEEPQGTMSYPSENASSSSSSSAREAWITASSMASPLPEDIMDLLESLSEMPPDVDPAGDAAAAFVCTDGGGSDLVKAPVKADELGLASTDSDERRRSVRRIGTEGEQYEILRDKGFRVLLPHVGGRGEVLEVWVCHSHPSHAHVPVVACERPAHVNKSLIDRSLDKNSKDFPGYSVLEAVGTNEVEYSFRKPCYVVTVNAEGRTYVDFKALCNGSDENKGKKSEVKMWTLTAKLYFPSSPPPSSSSSEAVQRSFSVQVREKFSPDGLGEAAAGASGTGGQPTIKRRRARAEPRLPSLSEAAAAGTTVVMPSMVAIAPGQNTGQLVAVKQEPQEPMSELCARYMSLHKRKADHLRTTLTVDKMRKVVEGLEAEEQARVPYHDVTQPTSSGGHF